MKKARKHITFHPNDTPHYPYGPMAVYIFLFVAILGFLSVHEPRTWLHIKSGEIIAMHGLIPDADTFTYTVSGKPWTTGTWLADLIFFNLDRAFGQWGIIAVKSLAAGLAYFLLLPINPASPALAAGVLALGAAASWAGFTETPAVFDLLFFALFVRLLRPRRKFTWFLGLVLVFEVLWANMHVSMALFGVWLLGIKVVKVWVKSGHTEFLRYLLLLALTMVAALIHPYGWKILPQLFEASSSARLWQPDTWASLYGLFVFAGAVSCWVTLQTEFFLSIAAATLLALSLIVPGLRPLYILSACPVITLAIGHFSLPRRKIGFSAALWAVFACGLLLLHGSRIYLPFGRAKGYGAENLAGAVHYLQANGLTGRMFNEIEAGDALIGRGKSLVFVDGRSSLYTEAFIKDASNWSSRWSSLDGIYGFDYALILNRRSSYPAEALDQAKDWRLTYADDAALVYVKRSGENGWLVKDAPRRLIQPNRLWPDVMDKGLSEPKRAPRILKELDRWIVQSPDSIQALIWKAYALDRMNLPAKAERLLGLARSRDRLEREPEILACFAFVLEKRGKRTEASIIYEKKVVPLASRLKKRALEAAALERLSAIYRAWGRETRAANFEGRAQALRGAFKGG